MRRELPGRPARELPYTYVRWHARGYTLRRTRWFALLRTIVLMAFAIVTVTAIAQSPPTTCPAGPTDIELVVGDDATSPISAGRALAVLAWWLLALVLAVLAIRRVVRVGQRRSLWLYPNWHRRIQGSVASTLGKALMLGVLLMVLGIGATGVCDVPEWFGVLLTCALFGGLLLAVFGSAVATEAGWVGFALVVIVDLLTAALLLGYAVLDPADGRSALVGAAAFGIHAVCTAVACRWSFVVATIPGTQPDDRAKAGETGRSLCALWVLLLIASLVVIFDQALLTGAMAILTSPIAVALTLGALAVTLGSGHTKYVEAREAARRRNRDRRTSRTRTPDRRYDLVPRIAARMVATCGPLTTDELAAGVHQVLTVRVPDGRLRKELGACDLLVRDRSDDTWDLSPTADPAALGWPTDRALCVLARRTGRRLGRTEFTRPEIVELLDEAGYRGLESADYALDRHPLIRRTGGGLGSGQRRWRVRSGRVGLLNSPV